MEKGLYSSAYEHDACGVGMVEHPHPVYTLNLNK